MDKQTVYIPAWTVTYGGHYVNCCASCPHYEEEHHEFDDTSRQCTHPTLWSNANGDMGYWDGYWNSIWEKCPLLLKENENETCI